MPVPVPVSFVDAESDVRVAGVRPGKDSGYRPDPTYYPTMKAVRCGTCGTVGVAEFVNGFNLKEADKLMAGRPIKGLCLKCNTMRELVPLEPNLKKDEAGIQHLYRIQQALDEHVRRGERLAPSGLILPLAKRLDNERREEERRRLAGESAGAA